MTQTPACSNPTKRGPHFQYGNSLQKVHLPNISQGPHPWSLGVKMGIMGSLGLTSVVKIDKITNIS